MGTSAEPEAPTASGSQWTSRQAIIRAGRPSEVVYRDQRSGPDSSPAGVPSCSPAVDPAGVPVGWGPAHPGFPRLRRSHPGYLPFAPLGLPDWKSLLIEPYRAIPAFVAIPHTPSSPRSASPRFDILLHACPASPGRHLAVGSSAAGLDRRKSSRIDTGKRPCRLLRESER